MTQFYRLLWYVSIALCLMSLPFACAPQPSFSEERLEPVGSEGTGVGRATAAPGGVTLTPWASMSAQATLGVEALTPANAERTRTGNATETPAGVTLTPLTSLSVPATSDAEVLTPALTIVKGEIEMMPTVTVSPGLQRFVDQAVADLADRLAIAVDQVDLIEVKEVVWPNASLGCPQPGMRYRQVPMDGLLIRLGVGDQEYAYHSGGSRDPFLCEQTLKMQKPEPLDLEKFLPPIDPETDWPILDKQAKKKCRPQRKSVGGIIVSGGTMRLDLSLERSSLMKAAIGYRR